jgi:hypothetical protein
LGNAQDLAKTFAQWQSVISTPKLDRKFASTLNITPVGIIISGAISIAAVFVKKVSHLCSLYSGTYFGTRAEYDILNIEAELGIGSLIKVDVIEDWLGAVLNWAENEALQIVGGIVSLRLQAKLYTYLRSHLIYHDSPPLFTRRVLVSRLKL